MRYYVTRVDWRQSRMPAGPPSGGSGGLGKRAAAEARAGTRMAGRCCAGTPGTGYAGLLRRIAVSTGARYWRPAHPSTGGPNILEARIFLQEWCELSSAPGIT